MQDLIRSFRMFISLSVILGILYPLLITFIGQFFLSEKVNGDLITKDEKIIGAKLIGQQFESDRYFFSRPSAVNYEPLKSSGSNLFPTSQILRDHLKERALKIDPSQKKKIPSDLLYASASGLDPDITKNAAYFQIERVVKARGLDPIQGEKELKILIDRLSHHAYFSPLRESIVNVLLLNLSLDDQLKNSPKLDK